MKTTNKLSVLNLFIPDGDRVELLRIVPKSAGFYAYLPSSISRALNLNKNDHNLVCFIDDESNYPYVIITKDSVLAEELRPWIYEKRKKAELLHKELKKQIQAQQQAETEAKQDAIEVDV